MKRMNDPSTKWHALVSSLKSWAHGIQNLIKSFLFALLISIFPQKSQYLILSFSLTNCTALCQLYNCWQQTVSLLWTCFCQSLSKQQTTRKDSLWHKAYPLNKFFCRRTTALKIPCLGVFFYSVFIPMNNWVLSHTYTHAITRPTSFFIKEQEKGQRKYFLFNHQKIFPIQSPKLLCCSFRSSMFIIL